MRKYNGILIFLLLSPFIIILWRMLSYDFLYFNDPYNYLFLTKNAETESLLSNTVQLNDGIYRFHYKSLMRTFIFIYAKISGLDEFTIFKFFGILPRIGILIFLIGYMKKESTKSNIPILCGLAFSSNYFVWRGHMTFTENFVLFYFILYSILFFQYIKSKKREKLALGIFFLVSHLYYHYPSMVVTFWMSTIISIFYLTKKTTLKEVKVYFIILVILSIMLSPIIGDILRSLIFDTQNNLGRGANPWGNADRYKTPNIDNYIYWIGGTLLVITLQSSIRNIRYYSKKESLHLYLMLMLIVPTLIALGTNIGINISSFRNNNFLLVCSLIMIAISQKKIIHKKCLGLTLVSLIILSGFLVTSNNKPWKAYSKQELEIQDYLIEKYPNFIYKKSDTVPYGILWKIDPKNISLNNGEIEIKASEMCQNQYIILESGRFKLCTSLSNIPH